MYRSSAICNAIIVRTHDKTEAGSVGVKVRWLSACMRATGEVCMPTEC